MAPCLGAVLPGIRLTCPTPPHRAAISQLSRWPYLEPVFSVSASVALPAQGCASFLAGHSNILTVSIRLFSKKNPNACATCPRAAHMCMHVALMLHACCTHAAHMLPVCCTHVTRMLHTCCMHIAHMLHRCCMHVAYMLRTCCVHVAYVLRTCCTHIARTFCCVDGMRAYASACVN